MDHPLFSVIIPSAGRACWLPSVVGCVMGQTYPDHEVIVIDEDPSDTAEAVLRPLGDHIRYVRHENTAPDCARNRGILESVGEWIAFLDCDDRWLPEKLEIQLEETQRQGADFSFHDSLHRLPAAGRAEARLIPSWNEHVSRKSLKRPALRTGRIPDLYGLLVRAGHLFLSSTMIIRREALLQVGGFDPSTGRDQEIDLFLRLAPRFCSAWIDQVLVEHVPEPQQALPCAPRSVSIRAHTDRILTLRKAFCDRMNRGDTANARLAKQGILRQMRSLGALYRKHGMIEEAVNLHLDYLQLSAAPLPRRRRRQPYS